MYCSKCGKFIGTDETICEECKCSEIPTPIESPVQPVGSRKEGFKGALASTVLSIIAVYLSAIVMFILLFAFPSEAYDVVPVCIIMTVACIVMGVISIVLGAKGIKCFNTAKKEGRVKPVATLVCAINGLVTGISTMIVVAYDVAFTVIMASFI